MKPTNSLIQKLLDQKLARNKTDPPVVVTDSSASDYDSEDESLVCTTTLPSLENLAGAEPVFGPKTIKLILKLNSTFKAGALKGVIINEPSLAPAKGNKSALASKASQGPGIISLRRGIKPRNPQHVMKSCETCGSIVQTTTDHNDIEWFRRGKALQPKKSEALKLTKAESSNENRSKTPTKSLNRSIDSDKYLEGKSFQRPPLFESDHFIYWKNRFETYVKAKDLDLWHIILNDDFPPLAKNEVTQILEVVPFEEQSDDLKKKLAKNNKAKMVLYNTLPKKEYERSFMCKMAKDIWQSLLITHQGNSQVKDNKIDHLVQQYEQFTILEEESIDSGFARFNTLLVLKLLMKMNMEKDSEIYRGKKERVKSIALKAKKESSDDETSTSGSDDEEYAMAVRNFKKFFRRKGKFVRQPREEKKSFRQRNEKKGKSDQKCFRCGDPNHFIGDCPKPTRNKDQKAFIGGSWSDRKNDAKDKTNDESCLMAQSSNEVTLNSSYYSDNAYSLDNDTMQVEYDSLCEISLKFINKNKTLKTKSDLLEKEVLELNEKIKKLERSKEIDIACKSCQELKLENAKLKETQVKFVKFDKSANSLREMLDNQKSSSCKIGQGFDSSKALWNQSYMFSWIVREKAMRIPKVHRDYLVWFVRCTHG
ncbi:zf-CCHC domain-containing protein [Tanacetum coccineum]